MSVLCLHTLNTYTCINHITGIIHRRKVLQVTFFGIVHEKTFAIQAISCIKFLAKRKHSRMLPDLRNLKTFFFRGQFPLYSTLWVEILARIKIWQFSDFSDDIKLKSRQSRKPHFKLQTSTLNFAKLIHRQIQLLDKTPNFVILPKFLLIRHVTYICTCMHTYIHT